MSLMQRLAAANAIVEKLTALPREGRELPPELLAAIHAAVDIKAEIYAASEAFLAVLPPVPGGYYLAQCQAPEGGCIGWHVYAHVTNLMDIDGGGGFFPTGQLYCDGGAPITQAWRDGTLEPWDSLSNACPWLEK